MAQASEFGKRAAPGPTDESENDPSHSNQSNIDAASDPLTSQGVSNQRAQAVFIRSKDEKNAMPRDQRQKKQVKAFVKRILGNSPAPKAQKEGSGIPDAQMPDDPEAGVPQTSDEMQMSDRGPTQYRLEATSKGQTSGFFNSLYICCCRSTTAGATGIGVNANQNLAVFLHWMFRVNFVFLFAVMCVIFFVLVIIFAGIIVGAGNMDPQCVQIGGNPFDTVSSPFADAFSLSWTTFSTVGYGSTYPALGHENDSASNCVFITIVCSLESFLGVLYSGFCGAILFGKVLRIQSHAQVIFSDPMLIRYGNGIEQSDRNQDGHTTDEDAEGNKKIPCPVLEFRVINRLFNEVGGEIMDATLNVVANVDANDADPNLRNALDNSLRFPSTAASSSVDSSGRTTHSDGSIPSQRFASSLTGSHRLFDPFASLLQSRREHQAVDEDPSSRLVRKRIFSKMHIEASDHPFFKRVWLARHVLDDTSPIVKPRVRRQIRRNGGYWPEKLNNHADIRNSLQFNQILVSLNGVSNVSASDVYAQKIYDIVDCAVGYQFVNVLYRDSDGNLAIDTDLINDVREQKGGGGEPLILDQ